MPIFLKWKLPKSTVKFTIHVGKKIGVSFLLCHMEREMPKDISGKIDDRCYAHIGSVGRIQKLVSVKKNKKDKYGKLSFQFLPVILISCYFFFVSFF